jgi:EmrB/QacA subfamily drug resistance transporter
LLAQKIAMRARAVERKWWVLAAIGVGAIMTTLDTSVVNIILPVLTRHFSSNIATIEWVVTIYLLVISSLLLTFGRLGDMRGHKTFYMLGFAIFILGSALSGAAWSAAALIAFRALQGLGAAMLFANSPAILTHTFPAHQRGQALGMHGMLTYLGLTAGPSLGGWLTETFGWRSVFFINLPVGFVALWMSSRAIPRDHMERTGQKFDYLGGALFNAGLVSMLLALDLGESWGWTSPTILLLLIASLVLLTIFLSYEARVTQPMLDLTLFRSRPFSAAVASSLLNYICLNCALFLLPFYLIQGRGLDPAHAGLILTAQPLIMAIATPLSGRLSDRIGSRIPGTIGMAILATGLFFLAMLGADTPLSLVALVLAMIGLGTGIFIAPNSSALMGSAPKQQQGIAAGILATARNVGTVLGVGFAGAIFTTALRGTPLAQAGRGLFTATGVSFLAAGGFALLGVFTSALRGEVKAG